MTVADRRRRQLDEALVRAQAALSSAGVHLTAQPSDLGLARLVVAGESASVPMSGDVVALATRLLAQRLATAWPGRTVEVRIPPYAAVQVGHGQGPRHTRGTPPSVVETDALTFLRLATGDLTWAEAVAGGVRISGVHADLDDMFPFG
ncbi:MAG TPA: sterol carrier family protein [Propionibacteriaceae bacterium]|nr:sterol carrier family protein [Propionibacteriaceae bacterium]